MEYTINEFGEIIRQGIEIPSGMTLEEYTQANLEAEQELENFYEKNPVMDTRPDSKIPDGMTVEEYAEAMEGEDIAREQEEYMEQLAHYLADARDTIQSCSELKSEIEERIAELEEYGSMEEGSPEYNELYRLYDQLDSINEEIKKAIRMEKFYQTQIFREDIKTMKPSEVIELYENIGKDKLAFLREGKDEKNEQILSEISEREQIVEDYILSSEELSELLSQKQKKDRVQTSPELMEWLEGKTITPDEVEKATSGVRLGEFKQATSKIRESAKDEQEVSNDEVSLDE